jgi:hypothetical protein
MASEMDELKQKLDKLGERLRKRTREFQDTGRFSNLHRGFLDEIEKGNDALRAKVESAGRSKDGWEFTKAELWRDYATLVNNVLELDERLDAQTMRKP